MPRLSVIMPAYNASAFIEKSAGSVLKQSFRDLELIIVDDGSTDDTAAIAKRLAHGDGRIRYIRRDRGGVSAARNAGIAAAEGELIAFVDADDHLEKDAYELMVSAMDRSGAESAMCAHYRLWPDGTREIDPAPFEDGLCTHDEIMNCLVRPLLEDRISANLVLGTVWRYLFSRKRILEMDIKFSGAYLEDEMFLVEYFALPTSLVCVQKPLYNYLQNPASVTRRYLPGYTETFLRSLDIKKDLVAKYAIPVEPVWVHNSCWAGLLIAAANEFAPGNPRSMREKRRSIEKICSIAEFESAIKNYKPEGMGRNKAVVARLLRHRAYFALSCLYALKNRNRK